MSSTHDIPRAAWEEFFGAMARTERDRRVWLEVNEPGAGTQHVAERLPFVGVTVERRGGRDVDVVVEVGPTSDFQHRVTRVDHVYALEGDDGRLQCLDLQSAASHTLVRFE
jgi:hypothetical protein